MDYLDYLPFVLVIGSILWCVLGYWWSTVTDHPWTHKDAALPKRIIAMVLAGPLYWGFCALWAFANRLRHD